MAERIDELQLGISSDAQSAIDQLGKLSDALGKAAAQAEALGSKASGVNSFVTGLKDLSNIKFTKTVHGLTKLSKIDLSNLENKNINIGMSVNGNADTINNIGAVANAMKKLSNSGSAKLTVGGNIFSEAFRSGLHGVADGIKTVQKYALNLGKSGVSSLGSFMSKLGLIPGHTKNVNSMALSFGNLLRAVLPFYGIRGIFDWLKESVGLGSSIVELENVIDTAFGSLKKGYSDVSGYIYDWAKGTLDAYGISEVGALKYAGRLQSIFNSSGFDVSEGMRNSATKMTTDLIERAGDIASFYDITVDEAMTKMQSGLVGMSRPLRSLGINLSVANMEAYAMSQGINTAWKEMDQASQMALRYSYIMSASQYAAGDFQKTSMSLANQLRVLQLNFQMLSTTIGQGFVSAIAPVVGWLNALIRKLIQAANAFRVFMWTLFGKPIGAAKGVADDLLGSLEDSDSAMGDLGSGASGASDGLGSAGKAAKELKKQLTVLPFDELNQLAKDTSSAGSGGSGGGGGGGVGGLSGLDTESLFPDLYDDLTGSKAADAINKWAARIRKSFLDHDWEGLGTNIAYMLNAGFAYVYDVLDWNKWKDKVYNFIHPFHVTINTMMDKLDWGLIGRTFARGLNDIVYILRMWITGFNWRRYGELFALGLNSMLDEWDADAFGRLIADKFKVAWDWFGGFVSTFDFASFGTKLKEGIKGAIDELDPKDMGRSLGKFVTGLGTTLKNLFGDKEVANDVADGFAEFVNGFLEEFDAKEILSGINAFADSLTSALGTAIKGIDKTDLAEKFTTVLVGLPWGSIALAMATVAIPKFVVLLFGYAFKKAVVAQFAKLGLGSALGSAIGGVTPTGASGATATTAAASGGISLGAVTATTLGVATITLGGIAIGKWLDNKLRKMFPLYGKGADAQKTAKESGATGSSTSYSDYWKNFGKWTPGGGTDASKTAKDTNVTNKTNNQTVNTVTTVAKAQKDKSFSDLQTDIANLQKNPKVTKTADGVQTGAFKTLANAFHAIKNHKATKTGDGVRTSGFNTLMSYYHGIKSNSATKTVSGVQSKTFTDLKTAFHGVKNHTATKTADGKQNDSFKKTANAFHKVVSNTATKKADGYTTKDFDGAKKDYDAVHNKTATVTVDVDIDTAVTEVVADIQGAAERVVASFWTRKKHAKGGLFTGEEHIFGEAGAEAVLPLTSRRSMKMIGNAISNAGGMTTSSNSELADEIAMRILPAVASIVNGQSERPMNVNAVLYTENNEVLARAVNQGNRSLDKRYHPVAQYSY